MAAIEQLDMRYHAVQDRLVLRLKLNDDSDLHLWLTRRMIMPLWQLLREWGAASSGLGDRVAPESREQVLEFEREAALSQADFSQPYRPAARSLSGGVPLLVAQVGMEKVEEGEGCRLLLTTAAGKHLRVDLTPQLIHGLAELLVKVAGGTDWGLAFGRPASISGAAPLH
jgi:hypothetical protein